MILTLFATTGGVLSLLLLVSIKAPPIRTTAAIIDMIVAFIKMIILKIKDGWYKTNYHQAIDKIKECEHDDN